MCAAHKATDADYGMKALQIDLPPALDPTAALFIDVDGTLVEIAARPELVRVQPGLPALLDRLAEQRDGALALVSGRPLLQIDRLFAPWLGAAAGLHGAQRRRPDGGIASDGENPAEIAAAAALDRLRPAFAAFAEARPGVWLEDKGATLALHYRAAPEREAEIRELGEKSTREAGEALRMIAGKMVVELQPRCHGKDGAVAAFMAEPPFRGRVPVFLGDDTTDEDGFAEVNRRGGMSVRVGEAIGPTAADYLLPSVRGVHEWLEQSLRR
jgi:trehalose 6-phosphate phosphatase